MKKLFLLLAIAGMSLAAQADNVDKLFEKYKGKSGVEVQKIDQNFIDTQMRTVLASITDSVKLAQAKEEMQKSMAEAIEIFKELISVEFLNAEDAGKPIQEELLKDLSGLQLKNYETLIETNDDSDAVKIYQQKQADDTYRTVIIVNNKSDDEIILVRLHTYKDLINFAQAVGKDKNIISYGKNKNIMDLLTKKEK